MPRVGVTAGRYGGRSARITGSQSSGTGGWDQVAGSEYWVEWVGITRVPVVVRTD
jgi:hypothetical protein